MSKKKVRRVIRSSRRASSQEIQQRMARAALDPDILRTGVVVAMRKHRLNYANIMTVRRSALSDKIRAGKGEDIITVQEDKRRSRQRACVLRAENKYPLIHRRIYSERNMSIIARDYDVTRERVRQVRKQFAELMSSSGRPLRGLLDEVEEAVGSNGGNRRRR